MTTHHLNFKDLSNCPIYSDIVKGRKRVEGRKNSSLNQKIKEGDILILADIKGELHCRVTYVHKYSNIREYLEYEGFNNALPCTKSIDEAEKFYEKFVPKSEIYHLNEKFGYGFLGIGIELIKEIPNPDFHQSGGQNLSDITTYYQKVYHQNKYKYCTIKEQNNG